MSYIYSPRNRNRQYKMPAFLTSALSAPKRLWNRLRQDRVFRKKSTRFVLYFAVTFLLVGSIALSVIALTLPDPSKLGSRVVAQSTKIYARDASTLLYEIHGEAKRTLINLSEVPDHAKQATVALEDKNFYNNRGIEVMSILRAFWRNTILNKTGEGGSTITQQFVKNAILTREKSYVRKIKEAVLSIEISQRYTKDEILQMYLNEIPYGRNAYGIEAAAQTYFGKNASNLTLAESAYLAALPQAPSFYNPSGPNRARLDNRKNFTLDQMANEGYITKEQAEEAKNEKVTFSTIRTGILAPHFVLYVQSQLAEKYGERTLEEGGLKVITSLDWTMQQAAEQAVRDGVARNERYNAQNAGLVAMDPKTGQVLAMVGSRNYFDEEYDGQVNIALQELQPGSSIKPYVYATAFKQGMNPATMLMDVRTTFGTVNGNAYAPTNYDGSSKGIVNMRKALAGSLNISAVKTLSLVGVQNAIDTARDLGITSNINANRCGLSLVLGGCEVRLIDHVSAMGVFANMGIRHEQTTILKIEDDKGNILEEYKPAAGREVIDPQVAFLINDIMSDNSARAYVFGSSSPLTLPGRTVAAKTGTTNEWRDGWTMGFTPSLVAGVWTGNNDNSKMRAGSDGVITAAPIWNQFMRAALKDQPAENFPRPSGIQNILVDEISGKLPTEFTPSTKSEVFSSFGVPTSFDDVHVGIDINVFNGKLATEFTPEGARETKVFKIIKSENPSNPAWENPVRAWAEAHGFVYPPTEKDDGTGPTETTLLFTTPQNNQVITSLPLTIQVNSYGATAEEVDFYVDDVLMGTSRANPFVFQLNNLSEGPHKFSATARLSNGTETNTNINITVQTQ